MNRATWLQDRRMQKFLDVLSRWQAGKLSMMEAGELLGVSERQFRRYRDRYEQDGLEGLVDRRLGKPSPKRVPERHLNQMLRLYCEVYRGWNVKHFYEHLCQEHGFHRGPSLTAAVRGVTGPEQVGTKKRPSGRTKKLILKKPEDSAPAAI